MTKELYRDFEISHNEHCGGSMAVGYIHVEFTGDTDRRYGYAASVEDAKLSIDDWYEEKAQ